MGDASQIKFNEFSRSRILRKEVQIAAGKVSDFEAFWLVLFPRGRKEWGWGESDKAY